MDTNTIIQAVAAGIIIAAAAIIFGFAVARHLKSRETRLEWEKADKAYRARNARMARRK